MALTRFKRTLSGARLSVRSLTHTLHLPPAHAEIYNGPHASWLREVLDHLPNLQSLIVRGLPFFDHSALVALKYIKQDVAKQQNRSWTLPEGIHELPAPVSVLPPIRLQHHLNNNPIYGLRLLDASRCTNVTATGLCLALKRLESLLYLDLSWTSPARDHAVLGCLRTISGLQVLKLKGIILRDEEIRVLAHAIGTRVRSLDIRHNRLTDRSVRLLLDSCFTTSDPGQSNSQTHSSRTRSPSLVHYLGADMLAIYEGQGFEAYLRNAFTSSFVSRLAIEDAPEGGITHLYISNNQLSVEGISGLARSGRLHVLNATVDTVRPLLQKPVSASGDRHDMLLPGAEKLAKVLADYAGHSLTHLSVNHDLVTKRSPKMDEDKSIPGRVELESAPISLPSTNAFELDDSCVPELPGPDNMAELDAAPTVCELSADEAPRFELPGDSIHMIVSPAIGEAPHATEQEEADYELARRGSAIAPEVVGDLIETPRSLHPASARDVFPAFSSPSTTPLPHTQPLTNMRPRTYSNLAAERKTRMHIQKTQSDGFHPGLMPRLKVLVLKDVPPFSPNDELADRLLALIHECAEEATFARQQAKLDYTLPPGRKESMTAIRNSTSTFFALEQIVLEMAPDRPMRRTSLASPWRHDTTKSMTEDRDSEALWSASETDFSFFGEGESMVFPSLDREPTGQMFGTSSEKELNVGMSPLSPTTSRKTNEKVETPQVDNISRLSQFRKAKKLEYQMKLESGDIDAEVPGYWPGIVKVVRPSGTYDAFAEDDESMDYYGNRFSNRGIYR